MSVEDFIENVTMNIRAGCLKAEVGSPKDIELMIQLNSKGNVCSKDEVSIGTLKVHL